jgi:pimeloyl-ACP methyl ester carboxylesterase
MYLIRPFFRYLVSSIHLILNLQHSFTMSQKKSTIVLIPGGWHRPSSYAKLTTALQTAGYTTHIPELQSMNGARPPTAGLKEDTAHVRTFVTDLLDTGKNVAVIMHSYSGQVGTNALIGLSVSARAAAGKSGGVTHLIYMSAFALLPGKSMVDKVREFGHEEYLPLAFDFSPEDNTALPQDSMYLIGETPGLEKEEVEAYAKAMTSVRWNGQCMYDATENCAWKEDGMEVAYVIATKDTCVPLDYQKSMVEGMKAEGVSVKTWEVEAGHCPNFTATGEVARIVGEIVG